MKFLNLVLTVILLILPFGANSALLERLGGLAYYDTDADLTWLADANSLDGKLTWHSANIRINDLTVAGVGGWRMPETFSRCDTALGLNCAANSEMGNLFYNVLGGAALEQITTTHNDNYYLFNNIQTNPDFDLENNFRTESYWSDIAIRAGSESVYSFSMDIGSQSPAHFFDNSYYVWAVQSGDVALTSVPVPAAVWLFASGLVGLFGFNRRFNSKL